MVQLYHYRVYHCRVYHYRVYPTVIRVVFIRHHCLTVLFRVRAINELPTLYVYSYIFTEDRSNLTSPLMLQCLPHPTQDLPYLHLVRFLPLHYYQPPVPLAKLVQTHLLRSNVARIRAGFNPLHQATSHPYPKRTRVILQKMMSPKP